MTRLLGALFVLILGWFGFLSAAETAIAMPTPSFVHAYDYDGHRDSPEPTFAMTERGPPGRAFGHPTYDAVGRWSHGAFARSQRDATPTAYTYNDLAEAVGVAKTAVTSWLVTPGVQPTAAGAIPSQVAAKGGDEAFHYTFSRSLASIEENGLRKGAYATTDGSLSGVQAHIDLALPPNRGYPDALIRVDLAGLRKAGYEIPAPNQLGRSFGVPGGGVEMQFPYAIPPEFLQVIPR